MSDKIRVAIIGYGNIGQCVFEALLKSPDMEIAGVVRRSISGSNPPELSSVPVTDDIKTLSKVDVAILCGPSRSIPDTAEHYLSLGINTVDSFDIHGSIWDLKQRLDAVARKHKSVSIVSAGWDPGTDSVVRAMMEGIVPQGITYTNFGPGMSMGHTVAVKAISGVKAALSMTIPIGTGIHRRMVYVEIEPGARFDDVSSAIKKDPYFVHDETHVIQVDDVSKFLDMGHGVSMTRKGVSGDAHNQQIEFKMAINNPALTGQVLVCSARASVKQQPGCYTLIEIPVIDMLYGDREELIRRLV